MDFVKVIQDRMAALEINQTRLSEMSGVGRTTITMFLSRRNTITSVNLAKLLDALDLVIKEKKGGR